MTYSCPWAMLLLCHVKEKWPILKNYKKRLLTWSCASHGYHFLSNLPLISELSSQSQEVGIASPCSKYETGLNKRNLIFTNFSAPIDSTKAPWAYYQRHKNAVSRYSQKQNLNVRVSDCYQLLLESSICLRSHLFGFILHFPLSCPHSPSNNCCACAVRATCHHAWHWQLFPS